jgi:hypothetical protein
MKNKIKKRERRYNENRKWKQIDVAKTVKPATFSV